ncbi:hypothetical protein ACJMK2_025697 [Sinanodonta woodiana]|uniref:Uncharacterized protein n=1 Tax=Sinanodonta woodiana TaxID=1069815 RepID=A0ABD3XHA9_SINWO
MRGDSGTEYGHVAHMQDFSIGKERLIYVINTANQRILMFLDFIDISLIQFYYMDLLQNGIDSMVQVWKVHRIQPTKKHNCPNGQPAVIYNLPMIYETMSYLQDVFNICTLYMEENKLTSPINIDDTLKLYCDIRNLLFVDL